MNLSFKNFYFRWIKNLCLSFVGILCLMTVARFGFMVYFGEISSLKMQVSDLQKAFFLGLRYDLIPLSYIYALPFLFLNLGYLVPGKHTITLIRSLSSTILFLGISLLLWLYISDYGFYSYFQDHLNILFFGLFEDDTIALIISLWKNYNVLFWLGVFLIVKYLLYLKIKMVFSVYDFDLKAKVFSWKYPVVFLSGLVLLAFFCRGNFTRLPLSVEDAHISTNEFINEVALNGVLTLNRAMKIRKSFGSGNVEYLKKYGFESWQEALKIGFPKQRAKNSLSKSLISQTPKNEFLKANPPHVVMIVMESFGSYWNAENSKEFNLLGSLESHIKDGISFPNFLSAENGTIGSMVSVATSQVIRPGARFLSESEFMKTSLDSAGHMPYKNAGYETHFIYGGKLGWRDLGKFLAAQNYDRLWGADEIKGAMPELELVPPRDLGNEWGVFDEYLYSFIEEQLRTATKPQFFLVLTTSNHPPFEYPSTYNELSIKLDDKMNRITVSEEIAHKRFMSLQYSNQKVGDFLTKLKTTSLGEKTVLALTGDHSYWIARGVGHEEEFKRFAVPFYIFAPESLRPVYYNANNFGSHEDIFPTLYGLTLSETSYVKLGEDLLREEGIAQNSSGLIANKDGAIHNGKFWKWKDLKNQILESTEPTEALENLQKRGLGIIGITDQYLREEKSRKSSDEESDRP